MQRIEKKEKEKLGQQINETAENLNDRILELKAVNVRLKVKELEVQELEQNLKSREDEIEEGNSSWSWNFISKPKRSNIFD